MDKNKPPIEDLLNFLSGNIEAASKSFLKRRQELIKEKIHKVIGEKSPVSLCSHYLNDKEYIFANDRFVVCANIYPKERVSEANNFKELLESIVPQVEYHQDEREVPMFLLYKYSSPDTNDVKVPMSVLVEMMDDNWEFAKELVNRINGKDKNKGTGTSVYPV